MIQIHMKMLKNVGYLIKKSIYVLGVHDPTYEYCAPLVHI